ncbi:MAG: sucrase ferredoxin [Acidimicrobiales bacterium]
MPDFECAVAARERDEPMFATASQVRRWLLIEVRGSWGRDSVANTDLARYASPEWRRQLRESGIRVIAIRRDLDRGEDRAVRVFYAESGSGADRGSCWRRDVPSLHAAVDATASLLVPGDERGWTPHDEPLVLVCTNGRHDSCCATFGRPLVRALRESRHAEWVWECSHIGGDRFAGNIVVLPDGLYFGRCDPHAAANVIEAYERGEIHLDHYRGRSTLRFMEQAAEFFARRELGLTRIGAVLDVKPIGERGDGTFAVRVADAGSRPETVTVTVVRADVDAPTPLTCTGPSGLTTPTYQVGVINVGR